MEENKTKLILIKNKLCLSIFAWSAFLFAVQVEIKTKEKLINCNIKLHCRTLKSVHFADFILKIKYIYSAYCVIEKSFGVHGRGKIYIG